MSAVSTVSGVSSSGSSYLLGSSLFLPTAGGPVKLTAEYANTIATKTPFGFDRHIYGFTYNTCWITSCL